MKINRLVIFVFLIVNYETVTAQSLPPPMNRLKWKMDEHEVIKNFPSILLDEKRTRRQAWEVIGYLPRYEYLDEIFYVSILMDKKTKLLDKVEMKLLVDEPRKSDTLFQIIDKKISKMFGPPTRSVDQQTLRGMQLGGVQIVFYSDNGI